MRSSKTALVALAALASCVGREKPAATGPTSLEGHFPLATATDAELCRGLANPRAPTPDPPSQAGPMRRKVILGDLHVGPGARQGDRFAGLDDFFADDIFARFLEELAAAPTELVIAGDFIDFWQIAGALGLTAPRDTDKEAVLGTDQRGSLAALDVAVAAHPQVFAALGKFLASGDHRLVLIAGNHDSDLIWPRVRLALARAIGVRDLSQLAFVDSVYSSGGVHIEHGHRLDAANTAPANLAGSGPVALDAGGRCRLQSSWGQVFVVSFFNELEQRFPFIDNLYPESAALMWGLREEPDVTESAIAGYRFADMLLSAQSGTFNLSALRAAVLGLAGASDQQAAAGDMAGIWENLPASETFWAGVSLLVTDAKFRPLLDSLLRAARALPDITAVGSELAAIDFDLLGSLRDRITKDPLAIAAAMLMGEDPSLEVVVFAHTHVPGGEVRKVGRGHYANTGTWAPIAKISDLKRSRVPWTTLSIENAGQFPRRFPALVIDYRGRDPQPPHIVYAQ